MFKIKTNKIYKIISPIAALSILAVFLFIPSGQALSLNEELNSLAEEVDEETQAYLDEISGEIFEKRERISEISQQTEVFKQNIAAKQREAASLSNEVYILDNQISLKNLEISRTEQEAEKIKLEMEKLQSEIDQKNEQINEQKDQISELIRVIFRQDQKSYLEIALLNENFSDFFNQVKYLSNLEQGIKEELDTFQALKHDLEVNQEDLSGKKNELEDKKYSLSTQKIVLDDQVNSRLSLLDQTRDSEEEYQKLLDDLKSEQQKEMAEITALERRARQRIGENLEIEFEGMLGWPVDGRRVTCGFHSPNYFAGLVHTGMDIGVSQGSPVYAAADGIVGVVKANDWKIVDGIKRSDYNYVQILHGTTLSTLYGHLSKIIVVQDDYVTRGQIIGYSGGEPGAAGTGWSLFWYQRGINGGHQSTAPHLHFEVRAVNENGIPVNVDPANYLY